MYTTTSKQQEGCTFEDSHPKCFITTNSTAKLSRGAVNRGDVHVLRASYTKVNSNTVIILILFDTTDYRCYMVIDIDIAQSAFRENNMTVKRSMKTFCVC